MKWLLVLIFLLPSSGTAVIFSVEGKGKSYQVSFPCHSSDNPHQARAILQAQLFEEYTINDPNQEAMDQDICLKFSLNLTTLLDCLQLFGSSSESTSATMTYLVRTEVLYPLRSCRNLRQPLKYPLKSLEF